MKKYSIFKLLSFLLIGLTLTSVSENSGSQELQITVSNIKSVEGNIMIAVYTTDQKFLGDEMVSRTIEQVTQTGEMSILVKDLPFGEYAISIYHDENANKTLDTNLFKMPTEPYGFSNDARGSFGPPSFEDAKIDFSSGKQKIKIKLN